MEQTEAVDFKEAWAHRVHRAWTPNQAKRLKKGQTIYVMVGKKFIEFTFCDKKQTLLKKKIERLESRAAELKKQLI